jgi:hypothetical protein
MVMADNSDDKATKRKLHFLGVGQRRYTAHTFLRDRLFLWPYTHDIDRGRIELGLQVCSIIFLDHFDAGPAVLGDLVDVRAFQEAQADVGVPEAVSCTGMSLPVLLETFLVKDRIEEFPVGFRKQDRSAAVCSARRDAGKA